MVRRLLGERSTTPTDLIVVGLGNPGDEYAQTRHNAGFWVVNELARHHGANLRRGRRDTAASDVVRIGDQRVVLVQPSTFYNEVGSAVRSLVQRHAVSDFSRLVIVHDELDLSVGRLKVKFGGGLAGNNGLKSVTTHLGTEDFTRIRVGIGKPESPHVKGRDYVLKKPARAERPILEEVVARASDAVEHLVGNDVESTMNIFNR